MAQSHPEPPYVDIAEAIHLQDRRDAKSEDPAQSLIHRWPVKDVNDVNFVLLQERELNASSDGGGSNGGDAVILSCGCAAAIPIVLGVYNHDLVPKLPWDLSLNALVSVLSAMAKSSLLYTICAALGQDKWDWSYTARGIREHQRWQQEQEEQHHQERQGPRDPRIPEP
ncbi:hypothetical protein B0T09DRAFT_264758 [Sordaria sp. MPI-SDFR-AT-0083]|nr:hypothetical protein B0T09DRAFT_264758 [Sordaria sp. MPI-SDFR-AT-0083]